MLKEEKRLKQKHSIWKRCCSALLAAAIAVTTAVTAVSPVLAAQGDTFDINREISRRFTTESLVLLRNHENVLPLQTEDQVAVFGSTQVNTFKTVFGSGSTEGIGIGFVDTLSVLETKTKVDSQLAAQYREFARTNPPDTSMDNVDNEILSKRSIPEMPLNDSIVSEAAQRNNKAVIFIGRTNGEGYDWQLENEYQLRPEEQNMIDLVTKYFDKVTVVLNTASPIDMTWDNDKIDSVLWVGICGDQGANAISAVLSGEANPSGKLTQTWAAKYEDTPTHMNYEMTNYPEGLHGPEVEYEEDIYAGYRYYDTFNVTPKFPFGYGLSYTTFDTEIDSITADSETVTVQATVTNTGDVAGKEVVQVYYSAPDGKMEKAYQELAAFAKTDLLQPNEKQTLTMTYQVKNMASYDEETARYVLEPGDYVVRVGNSSRNTHVGAVITLDDLAVTEQLSNHMEEAIPLSRFTKEGVTPYSYEGEKEEIASAKRIPLTASSIKTENNANTISDEPELLENSVEAEFVQAAQQELDSSGYGVAPVLDDAVQQIPGLIHCADLGVNFAGFVVNDPSGDEDGYKSVTVQKANTKMPFEVNSSYDGSHTLTIRYFVDSPSSVTLTDQNDKTLCTFQMDTTGSWAETTVENVDLTGVTKMNLITHNDNINLNWLSIQTQEYAGLVTATLPSGSYKDAVTVALKNDDCPDSTIYYTVDGSEPTTSSAVYQQPITVSADTTIKAMAVKDDSKNTVVSSFAYKIDGSISAKAVKPTYSFMGKDDNGNQILSMRTESGMSIFYTTDGSTPTTASQYYSAPISVKNGTTVKLVAVGPNCDYSPVVTVSIADVAAPTSNVETGGTYLTGQKVGLSSAAGTKIYYTMSTDGSMPEDPTNASEQYNGEISLDTKSKVILKAIAANENGSSEVATFVYQITDKLYTLEDVYNGDATVEQVVTQMNLSELVEVVSNTGNSSRFRSPGVAYADGPLGVKTNNFTKWAAPSLLACSWDVELFQEQGDAVGKEMVEEGIDFWLAPGANILRDPRSGRNSEYYAEDPVLTGVLASTVIQNVQKHGVGCVVKHFVGNDQETHRKQCANAIVSERALREIYLKAFEIIVKTSQPWGLMTTYCDVNRISTATNFELCTAIPRGEWGFENVIMTDWGCYADNGMMMYAGNDLVMPSGSAEVIKNSVLKPDQVNTSDPNYTKPTTKAMLQRNVVNIFDLMSKTNAFSRLIGQPQTYQYQVPEETWITTSKEAKQATVTVTVGENGSVSPTQQEVIIATDATFTVTPDANYMVDDVMITPVTAYTLDDNQLTVQKVKGQTDIQVTFKAIPESADFDGLNQLIQSAQDKLDQATIGGQPGNYLHTTAKEFQAEIDAAKVVAENNQATVMEVEDAIRLLKEAIAKFESQQVTQITHELTSDATSKIKAIDYSDASPVVGSEACSDSDGGQNTTGTYKGTYLEYTVDVDQDNVYHLYGRISTNEDNCGYEVYVDDVLQGSMLQEQKTGGWQNWATSDPVKVNLTAGVHTIKFVFTNNGINVNYFTLEPLMRTVTIHTDDHGIVSPSTMQVEKGSNAVFQLQPNDGFVPEQIVIDPSTSYHLKDNVLSVNNITQNTTVSVTFKQVPDTPDLDRLNALIETAQTLKDNAIADGTVGNYVPSVLNKFQAAIDQAKQAAANPELTATDIEYVILDLQQAINQFENSKVTQLTHIISSTDITKIKATSHSATSPGIGAENCQDEDGGQNPIYTDGGTWLEYQFDVAKTGWYQFTPRVSVNAAGAGFDVLVDGNKVAEFSNQSATGGWQNWVTRDPATVPLTEGTHTLRIAFTVSGMNVNWFQFKPMPTVVSVETLDTITVDYGISFEELSLPETVSVTLNNQTTRELSVQWDGTNYNPTVAGNYTLIGTLSDTQGVNNFDGLTASIQITVKDQSEPEWTVQEVADAIPTPVITKDTTQIALPEVPDGFTVELTNSSRPEIISLDGKVTHPTVDTEVELTYTVSKDGETAIAVRKVLVPGKPVEPTEVNKDILNKVITYAEEQKASEGFNNVIADVQESFNATLDAAKEIAADPAATQDAIDAAWKALMTEIHKLGFVKGDITSLEVLVSLAEGYDMNDYVEAGQAEFQAALKAAQDLLVDKDNAMQAEIKIAESNLLNAMLNLRYKADKSILEALLAEANGKDANAYTAESYAVLEAAVAEANAVMENENVTQEEVDTAVANVQEAMKGLVAVETPTTETPVDNDMDGTQTGQESTTTKANAAKTGDVASIAGAVALMIAAGTVIVLKKKK